MTTPTGGTSANLNLGVNTSEVGIGIEKLDQLSAAGVKTVSALGELQKASDKANQELKALKESGHGSKEQIALLQQAVNDSTRSLKEYEKAVAATVAANTRFLANLERQVAEMNKTEAELLRMKAAQLGVTAEAEKYIKVIEAQARAQSQIEYAANRAMQAQMQATDKVLTRTQYATLKAMEAEESASLKRQARHAADIAANEQAIAREIDAIKKKQAAVEYAANQEMLAKENAYLKATQAAEHAINKQMEAEEKASLRRQAIRKADEEAWARQVAKEISDAEKLSRTLERNANAQMAANDQVLQRRRKNAEEAAKVAEKQAIDEIRWSQMSAKAKYDELVKLAAYQQKGISQGTIDSTFSKAAQNDIQNTQKYLKEYAATLNHAQREKMGLSQGSRSLTEALSEVRLGAARTRSEMIVLINEIAQGRFTRLFSSVLVFAEYSNLSAVAMSGMGLAIMGVVAVLATYIAALVGAEAQTKKLNDALNRSNTASGLTTRGLTEVADAAGKLHGNYSDAYEASQKLAASGKFTADQLKQIIPVVTEMAHYFGGSLNDSIKEFESLIVRSSTKGIQAQLGVSRALLDLNDKYHFLNTTQMEQILLLEKEGRMREASALAIKLYTAEGQRASDEAAKYMGTLERGWHAVLGAIQRAKQAVYDFGKEGVRSNLEQDQAKQLEIIDKNKNSWNPLFTSGMRASLIADAEAKLIGIRKELKVLDDAALERGRKQMAQDEAMHIMRRREVEADTMLKRGKEGLAFALKKFKEENELLLKANPDIFKSEKAQEFLKAYEEGLRRTHAERKTQEGESNADQLRQQLAHIDAQHTLTKEAVADNERMLKDSIRAKAIDEKTGYKLLEQNRIDELASLERWLQEREKVLSKYKPANKSDAKSLQSEKARTGDLYLNQLNDVSGSMGKNATERLNNEREAYEKVQKEIDKTNEKEIDRIDKLIQKQKDYNETIGLTEEQIQLYKAAREESFARGLEIEKEILEGFMIQESFTKSLTAAELETAQKRLKHLTDYIAKKRELADLETKGAELQGNSPDKYAADATKVANQWKQASQTIADSLAKAFGQGGQAAANMFKSFASGQARQLELNKELVKDRAAADKHADKARRLAEADKKYNVDTARNQMSTYGDMTAAAAGFFDEESKGYKALTTMSQIFHAAELAMTVASLVPKAIAAVLNQANGDPYTAFGRMAAMAAIVAGLGVAVGAIGGSAPASTQDSVSVQKKMGTGTVFGDDEAKSESLLKALESIEDKATITMPLTSQMAMHLRNIDANMNGLANIVLRTVGITNGSNMDIKTGTTSQGMNGFMTTTLSILGGLVGTAIAKLWGSTKSNVTDSGLMFGGSVGSLQQGQGINQYANVNTVKKSWFGLKKESWDTLETAAVSGELSQQVGLVFKNLETVLKAAAGTFGKTGTEVSTAVQNFVLDATKISFKDLKGEELQQAINNVISAASDKISESVFPQLDAFRQVGEGYTQTIVRVASGIEEASVALERLNITAIAYTDIINKQGDVAAEIVRQSLLAKETIKAGYNVDTSRTETRMTQGYYDRETGRFEPGEVYDVVINEVKQVGAVFTGVGEIMSTLGGTASELVEVYTKLQSVQATLKMVGLNAEYLNRTMIIGAGSLEALTTGLDSYFENFFSEEEQLAAKTAQVKGQFAALNQVMPTTAEGFKALINGIDQTTEAGSKLFGQLIALAPALADLLPKNGTLKSASLAVDEARAEVSAALVGVASAVKALADRAQTTATALAASRSAISSAYFAAEDAVAAAQKKVIDLVRQSVDALTKFSTSLRDFINGLDSKSSSNTLANQRVKFDEQVEKAKNGDTKAQEGLTATAQQLLDMAKKASSTAVDYEREVAKVKNSLEGVIVANNAKIKETLEKTPGAATAVKTPMEIANAELVAAELKLAGLASAVAVTGASLDRNAQLVAGSAAQLIDAFNKANAENIKAQSDYAIALQQTAGLNISTAGAQSVLIASLLALDAANTVLSKAQKDLSDAITSAATAAGKSNLDYAKSLGLTGTAAEAFAKVMDDAKLTSSTYEALMKKTGFSADDLQKALSKSGFAADDMALMLGNASTEGGTLKERLTKAGTTVQEFADGMAGYGLSPANLKTLFGLSETAAKTLSEELGKGGDAVKTFRTWIETSKFQGGEFFKAIEDATGAGKKLVDALKLGEGRSIKDLMTDTGKSAEELTIILNTNKLTVTDFDKYVKETGLSAKAVAALFGADDKSGLRATIVLGGLSLDDFRKALDASNLKFETFNETLSSSGLTAKEFVRLGDLTHTPLKDLATQLNAAKLSGEQLVKMIDDNKGSIGGLATALAGEGGVNPTATALATVLSGLGTTSGTLNGSITGLDTAVLALSILLGGTDSGMVASFDAAWDSVDDLKTAMGLLGGSADAMKTLIDGFKLPVFTVPTVPPVPDTGTGGTGGSVITDPVVDGGTGTVTPTPPTTTVPPATGNIDKTAVEAAYLLALGRDGDPGGIAFWTDVVAKGQVPINELATILARSAADAGDGTVASYANLGAGWTVEKAIADDEAATAFLRKLKIPGYAMGGDFGGGVRIVGEEGPEFEFTGASRIMSNTQSKSLVSSLTKQDDRSELREVIKELRAVKEEVTILRREQREGDLANIRATKEGTKMLRDVTNEGVSVNVTVV